MKAKIITFKPCKSGEVTLYLGAGADLRELIDLIGQEVVIEPAGGKPEAPVDDGLKALVTMMQDYGWRRFEEGKREANENNLVIQEKPDLLYEEEDPFEFGEGGK